MLARDIAAVCIGLRMAVMIDYMPLTASAMLAILAAAETQAATLQQCPCKLPGILHCKNPLSLTIHHQITVFQSIQTYSQKLPWDAWQSANLVYVNIMIIPPKQRIATETAHRQDCIRLISYPEL